MIAAKELNSSGSVVEGCWLERLALLFALSASRSGLRNVKVLVHASQKSKSNCGASFSKSSTYQTVQIISLRRLIEPS